MNYGLNLQKENVESSYKDWKMGAMSKRCLAEIPIQSRKNFLPYGEVQRGREDFMACASIAPINLLETKFNWLIQNNKISTEDIGWLQRKGYIVDGKVIFSDRYTAIMSGTTREGNSLKAPLHAIHKYGLIPRSMLPTKNTMTFEDYHNKSNITLRMKALGKEFKARFKINYEKVYNFSNVDDMLNVAGYAWTQPTDGVYGRVEYPPNHVFMRIQPQHEIYDSYVDSVDGDFIKSLVHNYNFFQYGYRVIVSKGKGLTLWDYIRLWI